MSLNPNKKNLKAAKDEKTISVAPILNWNINLGSLGIGAHSLLKLTNFIIRIGIS